MVYTLFQVIDHYENPRNVGSLDKNDKRVGTGLVGAPACGDVMKLQVSCLFSNTVHWKTNELPTVHCFCSLWKRHNAFSKYLFFLLTK